ncbi:C1 family peptidase [candidate division CSSED10-310 bacterium]|uniref:C1 family peptidase n=1 Tax=candidate division CSSED10-310 bacterium TaxID=2855610 RepID=A0ABV6YTG1_UNCC1
MKSSPRSHRFYLQAQRRIVLILVGTIVPGLTILTISLWLTACATENVDPKVKAINEAIAANGAFWTAAETWVSRLSAAERQALLGTGNGQQSPFVSRKTVLSRRNGAAQYSPANHLPDYFTWTNHNGHNWLTPVRNQKSCGSCWAFAAVGVIEANIKISEQMPDLEVDLSEQHLVSCVETCFGCAGGWAWFVYEYAFKSGVPPEDCFEYQAKDKPCPETCSNWPDIAVKINDYYGVETNLEAIKNELMIHPISVSMHVYEDFLYYESGIYEHVWGEYEAGHAVVLVGYDDQNQCFIVRNSWGENWGEQGYFRIKYFDSGLGEMFNDTCLYDREMEPPPPPTGIEALNQYSQGVSGARLRQINISWQEKPDNYTYGFNLYQSTTNNVDQMTKVNDGLIRTNTYTYDNVPGDTDFVIYFCLTASLPTGREGDFSAIVRNQDP